MAEVSIAFDTAPVDHSHHMHKASKAAFVRHFFEMNLSMMVGMMIGGALGVSRIANTDLKAILWLVAMTVPMVAWMRFRGMSWRQSGEMSLGMVIPTAFALLAFTGGLIPAAAVNSIEHGSMLPGMLAVMLIRRKQYGL